MYVPIHNIAFVRVLKYVPHQQASACCLCMLPLHKILNHRPQLDHRNSNPHQPQVLWDIGGCRAQKEPGHGELSTYETFILWLKFNSLSHFFLSWQQGLPRHSPGMPWPAATYAVGQPLRAGKHQFLINNERLY